MVRLLSTPFEEFHATSAMPPFDVALLLKLTQARKTMLVEPTSKAYRNSSMVRTMPRRTT